MYTPMLPSINLCTLPKTQIKQSPQPVTNPLYMNMIFPMTKYALHHQIQKTGSLTDAENLAK